MNADEPPVIVHPPVAGHRRVSIRRVHVGCARRLADLLEFLRRAGIDPDTVSVTDPTFVQWRGGGPEVWR
jgi:hypothetical protein